LVLVLAVVVVVVVVMTPGGVTPIDAQPAT
jgi:hypothetical protein